MRYTEIDLQIEDVMWFGIDRNGFVISCTTAGIGNVPEFVCRSKEETEKLYDFFSAKLSDKADYSLHAKKENNELINESIALAKKGTSFVCYGKRGFLLNIRAKRGRPNGAETAYNARSRPACLKRGASRPGCCVHHSCISASRASSLLSEISSWL